MKALSIRQPWAWHILHSGKDIENRTWPTKFRGRVLIHAAKGLTRREYDDVMEFLLVQCLRGAARNTPKLSDLQRGGIVGSVEIVDCLRNHESDSPWFIGKFGFVLRDPQPLPFIPLTGRLGLFDVPDSIIEHEIQQSESEWLEIPRFLRRGSD